MSSSITITEEQYTRLQQEKEFVQNWLADLLETMEAELDRETLVRLFEGCGRGCFRRFPFKQEIARQGQGSLENLIEAYRQNFEIWREGNLVHIRYGETSPGCYCPAARFRPAGVNDLHCECTRMTHQTIFETALGRPFEVKVVESVRRGGKTCHFTVEER
ncbi:MAG: hypothetical protein EHM70_10785 [Chloroflexota bacterium]|nr:MAG: hypothetical protein EHM70_10785 [Chloroflexota bacterium]